MYRYPEILGMQSNHLNVSLTSCAAIALEYSKSRNEMILETYSNIPGCRVTINPITYYIMIAFGLFMAAIGVGMAFALKWIKPIRLYSKIYCLRFFFWVLNNLKYFI